MKGRFAVKIFVLAALVGSTSLFPALAPATTVQSGCQVSELGRRPTGEQQMEWVGKCVEGSTPATGGGRAPRITYNYEDFDYDDCAIKLREHRQTFEGASLKSTTVEDITVPLAALSEKSIRVDVAGASVFAVSFSTSNQRQEIQHRAKTVYADGHDDQSSGVSTGYGLHFQNRAVANRAAKILASSIRSCRVKASQRKS